ncbi:MAG: hypothetical protein Kow00124_00320 [Anaerolineae bacterium]
MTRRVAVIIPAYHSEQTIQAALETMSRQTYADYELIVVDSSPDDHTALIAQGYPHVRYEHHQGRLLPHAARSRGVALTGGELLVFSDPDIIAPPEWLERLVAAYEARGGAVVGAVACHGRRWLAMGMHLSKFDSWLPGGDVRRIEIGLTANMLVARRDFEAVGGFKQNKMLGDTILSWDLVENGVPIWFVPAAVVEHHHVGTWGSLLVERFSRGGEFAEIRIERGGWSQARTAAHLIVTLLPLRLIALMLRIARNAWRAGLFGELLRVSPVVVSAQSAWLLGEAVVYLRRLAGRHRAS